LDGQGDVSPLDKHLNGMTELGGDRGKAPVAPWMFALAGQQHSRQLASCDSNHWSHDPLDMVLPRSSLPKWPIRITNTL